MAGWKNGKIRRRYAEVAAVCLPLVLSTAAGTVMEFTDRVFLANYSLDAVSAAVPAGIVAILFIVFFSGACGYAGVFIAQYTGAGAPARVGVVLWQALYLAAAAGFLLSALSFAAGPLFELGGHPAPIRALEETYFRILCRGGGLHVAGAALSAFFTGRGLTRPVMMVSALGMLFNIPLDYALIFGAWGFPQLGIRGAGLATVASWGLVAGVYALMIFTRANNRRYGVRRQRAFDRQIFVRLLKFGVPGALQFSMDVLAFTFFVFMVGRIGRAELAVTNIVLSINSLAFMPALGFSMGVSTLVGQALGRERPREAATAVWRAAHLLLAYVFVLDFLYLLAPDQILSLFVPGAGQSPEYLAVMRMGRLLLRLVAAYVFVDALYLIFVGALKGAGDTRFIMLSVASLSVTVMVLPVYIGIEFFHRGVYFAWGCAALFIVSLFAVSAWRYGQGRWKTNILDS